LIDFRIEDPVMSLSRLCAAVLSGAAFVLTGSPTHAVELNPAAVTFKLPDQIEWKTAGEYPGLQTAVLAGDPSKPGLYVVMTKWLAGNHFSHPHFHPHDRFITVLKGTWWVGSGKKFDTNATVPMPAGAFVTHYGEQVHFDGAKDEDAVLVIVGEGPATATPAEEK
jgi:quercetin dioxygenase-like cupin family protein